VQRSLGLIVNPFAHEDDAAQVLRFREIRLASVDGIELLERFWKIIGVNSRNALSYMASSSAVEGATLFAAKELSTSTEMTAIFLIFIERALQLSQTMMTSLNFEASGGKSRFLRTSRNRAQTGAARGDMRLRIA
jgi:hypothetical protein